MTHERDIERLLDTWFRDGPTEAPDRIVDAVTDRIGRQSQRPAWRLDWRHPRMTTTFKLASALAAIAIVAFLGWRFLPGSPDSSGVGGPGATPSAAPSASSSPRPTPTLIECEDDLPGCAGTLAPGTHRSNRLVPALTYETTGEWLNVVDLPTVYKIDQPNPTDPYVLLWTDAAIPDQANPCSTDPDPSLGRKAADWIAFLTTHPGLVASQPVSVDFGDTTGQQFELTVASDFTETCTNPAGPSVMFLTQPVDGRPSAYGLTRTARVLVTVVDVGGRTVVGLTYGPASADAFASSTAPVKALISTFRFD